MYPERRSGKARASARLAALAAVALLGCESSPQGTGGGSSTSSAGGGPPAGQAVSEKANVRFKRAERLRNDVARALDLAPGEVCNELGTFSCADFVHTVALGGADPYFTGLFEPFPDTSATAPLAVERLVLSACIERARRDFDTPQAAVVYGGLSIDAAGALVDPNEKAVADAIDRLYKRALQRPASAFEIERLSAFYGEVAAKAKAAPARQWATLTCFSVLTTMESLFY